MNTIVHFQQADLCKLQELPQKAIFID